jgi:N-formylglutamate amidohydrolase
MNAGAVLPAAPACLDAPSYRLRRPAALAAPLVFASPHSGRLYPPELMQASALDDAEIRRSEDAFVDQLIEDGLDFGATVLTATYARAFIDVNRAAYELDPAMFADGLPEFALGQTARVAAGLGSIARIVAEGQEIYRRKLTFAEAETRIEAVHRPYHAVLKGLVDEALARGGVVLLVDWHSMPAAATRPASQGGADMVLGDRFGASCAPGVIQAAQDALAALGYRVARNTPYAGGYTTELYGRPMDGVHALQIEISRGLYLDEARLAPNAGFDRLKEDLRSVFARLAEAAVSL